MTIGDRIREQRKIRHLTQKDLGTLSKTSETTIKQYELGKRQPRLEQLQAIATALEVDVRMLMDFDSPIDSSQEIEADAREYWQRLLAKKVEPLNARGMRKTVDYVLDISRIDEYTELGDAEKPAEGD